MCFPGYSIISGLVNFIKKISTRHLMHLWYVHTCQFNLFIPVVIRSSPVQFIHPYCNSFPSTAVYSSILQFVYIWCGLFILIAVRSFSVQFIHPHCNSFLSGAVFSSLLQFIHFWCSLLQFVYLLQFGKFVTFLIKLVFLGVKIQYMYI